MENIIVELNKKNPGLLIRSCEHADFKSYGNIVTGFEFAQLNDYMNKVEIPAGEVVYFPSIPELEENKVFAEVQKHFYGGQSVQFGYCIGDNNMLDGLEYHKGCEIVYAVTDLIVLLGHLWDIENGKYSSDRIEAFYVPAGTAVEVFGTTLHFAPCNVLKTGFKAVIILPQGTNCDFEVPAEKVTAEDKYLFANNKWLIAHAEAEGLIKDGVYSGITGKNLKVEI